MDTERETCTYDTGSMYGNVSACSSTATRVVTYWNGTYGPFEARVCDRHARSMAGRYPFESTTTRALEREE